MDVLIGESAERSPPGCPSVRLSNQSKNELWLVS